MAKWLRILVILEEGPGSIPSTHMVAHNYLQLQFQGYLIPYSDLYKHQAYMLYTYMHAGNSHINLK